MLKLKYFFKSDWAPSALKVALIVGSVLFVINHGMAVYENKMTGARWASAVLTYLVPYCVYIIGKASNAQD